MSIITCPCGSDKHYATCCEPYITGSKIAETPEALMRSRYSAYTKANVDYIANTMKGKASLNFEAEPIQTWAKQVEWLGLKVFGAKMAAENNDIGYVEFRASYRLAGKKHHIHELSEFHREQGRWYYVDGVEK